MSIRTERVGKLLQRELADILITEFGEQLQPMMTVTGTRVTKDLSLAYVNVSVYGSSPDQRQAAFKHLDSLTPQIRAALARRIRHQMRKVPELRFFLDETLEQAKKMERLFDQIRDEREQREDS
ncbi:MAG: 30S ribosome-binding factor RbfA [Bacteroidota bacterium]